MRRLNAFLPNPRFVDIESTEATGPIGVEKQQRTVARRGGHRVLELGIDGAPHVNELAGLVSVNACHRLQAPYITRSVAALEPESPNVSMVRVEMSVPVFSADVHGARMAPHPCSTVQLADLEIETRKVPRTSLHEIEKASGAVF